MCCAQRLCRSGSATEEAEQRINRGRRGAQAGPELEGPSGSEDGILPIPVSPSPASTSSQEDACKPPPRNCYRLVMLGSARVGKTAIVARYFLFSFIYIYFFYVERRENEGGILAIYKNAWIGIELLFCQCDIIIVKILHLVI